MTAKIRNKNDISKKWKRNILSSLEKEAPTISLLGYKKSGIKSDAAICLLRLMTQLSEVGEIGGS